jgi:hypothetical protein
MSEAKIIKLFTLVIYCHSMAILSFRVLKLYYLVNCRGMAVNYHGKSLIKMAQGGKLESHVNLLWNFNVTVLNYFYNVGSRHFEPLLGA